MLITLRIKNLALVDDLVLDLEPGFNAITGETGAGKSILIGALNLILGERADRDLIRSGADNCSVEALFDIAALGEPFEMLLDELGLDECDGGQLVLKRSFTRSGTNRQFVNGSPTALATLKQVGEWLVDIHGPHDHQSLLHPAKQLEILDAYGDLGEAREQFADLLEEKRQLTEQKAALIVDEQTYSRELDMLRFQVDEIESANLQEDDEETLEADYERATNAAHLLELAQGACAHIDGDDEGLKDRVGSLGRIVSELERIDPRVEHLARIHESVMSSLNDLEAELTDYADGVDLEPARLHQLEARINQVQGLKRKYGRTVSDVIAFGEACAEKLRQMEQRDVELQRINSRIDQIDAELWKVGTRLSKARGKVVPGLCKQVSAQLDDLGFKQSRLGIRIDSADPSVDPEKGFTGSGIDRVEFLFSPNLGEPPKPLRTIASSGEMARVMLALKTVLAAQDTIPVLVFDEIDANVGGETAAVVGEKMKQIGSNRQALCITHLAPVAAAAGTHFKVEKNVTGGKTVTTVDRLDSKQRVPELARMLGGKGDAQIKHAESLLGGKPAKKRAASRKR